MNPTPRPVIPLLVAPLLTGALLFSEALAGDVDNFGVVKGALFVQTDASAPTAAPGSNQVFNAFLAACSWQGVKSVQVIPPAKAGQALIQEEPWSEQWDLQAAFATDTARDTAYPDGVYQFIVETQAEGLRTNHLTVSVASDPPVPHVANYEALQSVNSASAFRISWNPIADGTVDDFVQIDIEDQNEHTVFSSPDIGNTRALNGTNTSVLVPSRQLQPGATYHVRLVIGRGTLYRSTQPGAVGIGGYFKQTEFNLRTVDTDYVLAVKGRFHSQTSSATPSPVPEPSWVHHVEVTPAPTTGPEVWVTNASVLFPGAVLLPLDPAKGFSDDAEYSSQSAMDTAHPNGTYTFTIKTVHDGTKSLTVDLAGSPYPPAVPRVANFDAAQAIRPDADFVLTWDAMGGTVDDLVMLEINDALNQDTVIRSPDPGHRGALNGTSTNFLIRAGRLLPGRSYQAQIIIARGATNATSYPGVLGFGGCFYGTAVPLRTAEVGLMGIVKAKRFDQQSAAAPSLVSHQFQAFVEHASSAVTNSVLRLPTGASQTLEADGDGFYSESSFDTEGAMNAALPSGNYTNTLAIESVGPVAVPLPLTADNYPAGPIRVSNFAAAQAIDSCRDFTLTWELPVAGATDYLQLMISDAPGNHEVFLSPAPGQAGALTGTNTSIVIPAGVLRPGRSYQATLLIARGTFDVASQPGTLVIAAFDCETRFPLTTTGTTIRPVITGVQFFGPPSHAVLGRCETENEVILEVSTTLQPQSWTPVSTNWPMGGSFSLPSSTLDPLKQFYRIREK